MNRILRNLPRLASGASRRSFTPNNFTPNVVRTFASAPSNLPDNSSPPAPPSLNAADTTPQLPDAAKAAQPDNATTPITPESIITSDAIPAEQALAAADAATTSSAVWSDTLLQPAISMLSLVHDTTGMPWWLTIGASTIAIRSMLLPVTLMTMKNSARMQALQSEIAEKREAIMETIRTGDRSAAQKKQADMQNFMRVAGVTPLKMLAGPLVQFPVFISLFIGIRRMAQSNPEFATGGAAWFTDLSVMDPTYVLPILSGISLVGMTELGGDTGSTKMTPQMKLFMRTIAVLSVPMTYWFPSAVFCYWLPNNCFSVLLGFAMRRPALKKALGIHVDVSTIPGTKAAKLMAADKAAANFLANKGKVDNAAAIASYGNAVSGSAQAAVKPVLLKQRPNRKNVAQTTR